MSSRYSENFIAIPPGKGISEIMLNRGISIDTMAENLCLPKEYIYDLLEGDAPLTDSIADKLEEIFQVPGSASLWKNLEKRYRNDLHKVNQENAVLILEPA